MFALLCVAAGAAAGCGVCAFGMWAFSKGQSAAAMLKPDRRPDTVRSRGGRRSPDADTAHGDTAHGDTAHGNTAHGNNTANGERPTMAEQLGSMFGGGKGGINDG